ncbi:MAG: acyl-CoA dehydrogenase family protein [Spongiibacter sp.]|nr:acyl-CoA dehydrogenase family protein [Spongiibacter sp.]
MELGFSQEEERFRAEVREFFQRDYPASILDKIRRGQRLEKHDQELSQQALQSRGWLGFTLPQEFGGPGWSPVQRYIFEEELELAGAPNLVPMAIIYVAPVIAEFGSPEQQQRWLPNILSSKAFWAQGYSEPEAGSDLASLGLQARRDGDHYVLNGSKIWTTLAHWADWIFCLVRTSREEKKQQGISFVCVEMSAPGVTVEPIITMNGSHELNRVHFDNVRVPVANRIGDEGQGWHYANYLLKHERLSYAHIGRKKRDLQALRDWALSQNLLEEPLWAARFAALEVRVANAEMSVFRSLGGSLPAAAVSALKIQCTELAQAITRLGVDIAGLSALAYPARDESQWSAALAGSCPDGPVWADAYLFERAQTIYGGTSEVQKNIIWRALSAA